MKNHDKPSLLERLEAHHQAGYLSLHMPGHKENTALAPYLAQLGAQWDITELPGFDDLHDPSGILAPGHGPGGQTLGQPEELAPGQRLHRGAAGGHPGGHPPGGTRSWWPGTATRPSTTPSRSAGWSPSSSCPRWWRGWASPAP